LDRLSAFARQHCQADTYDALLTGIAALAAPAREAAGSQRERREISMTGSRTANEERGITAAVRIHQVTDGMHRSGHRRRLQLLRFGVPWPKTLLLAPQKRGKQVDRIINPSDA
jgi:hypothetical protein